MRDRRSDCQIINALGYATTTGNRKGGIIDTRGFNACTFAVEVGTITTASATHKFTVDLYHANDNLDGDGEPAVDAFDVVPATERLGAAFDIDNTGDANKTGTFGYVGGRRYLQVRVAETGTAQAIIGATVTLDEPANAAAVADYSTALN